MKEETIELKWKLKDIRNKNLPKKASLVNTVTLAKILLLLKAESHYFKDNKFIILKKMEEIEIDLTQEIEQQKSEILEKIINLIK